MACLPWFKSAEKRAMQSQTTSSNLRRERQKWYFIYPQWCSRRRSVLWPLRCTIFINDLFYFKTEAKLSNKARDNQLYFAVADAAVVEHVLNAQVAEQGLPGVGEGGLWLSQG